MKNLILIIIFSFSILSCANKPINNIPPNIPSQLIGKWKIFEVFDSPGDCIENCWVVFDSGKEFDIWLKEDGTYVNNSNEECPNCIFQVQDEKIYFYPNGDTNNPAQIKLLNDNFLTLWWRSFEGAGNKYKKIIE